MPLKIALLTYSTKPRGSVIHTLEIAEALAALGQKPYVFALDKDGKGFHRPVSFKTFAVPASVCKGDTDALIRQRIEEFVCFFEQHAADYDVYHAQDCLSANALAELKARGRLARFIRTVHHIEDFKSPYLRACQDKSIYQSDRCLCVSQLWQQVLKRDYGVKAHRVINGVSQRFSAQPNGRENALTAAYGIHGDPVYLTVGGIEPRKNSANLLKAFHSVWQQQPSAQLVIVGGATLFDYRDYRQDFMDLVKAYGMKDALVLPGVVPDEDLSVLYRLADAFVFPSVEEGWGLVVLEAIASGLPVLTSNIAPFTEFLSPLSAVLVDPEDVEAIASGMLKIADAQTAQDLTNHGSQLINRYSWEASARLHLDLYEQIV